MIGFKKLRHKLLLAVSAVLVCSVGITVLWAFSHFRIFEYQNQLNQVTETISNWHRLNDRALSLILTKTNHYKYSQDWKEGIIKFQLEYEKLMSLKDSASTNPDILKTFNGIKNLWENLHLQILKAERYLDTLRKTNAFETMGDFQINIAEPVLSPSYHLFTNAEKTAIIDLIGQMQIVSSGGKLFDPLWKSFQEKTRSNIRLFQGDFSTKKDGHA